MKAKEVPQDPSMLGEHRRACYATNDKGEYIIVPSKGWEVESVVNSQAIDEVREQIETVRQQALKGEVSPLTYHMALRHMDARLLAANTGIWRWKVKRHLTVKGFAGLSHELLMRYADALGMDVERLRQVPEEPEYLVD